MGSHVGAWRINNAPYYSSPVLAALNAVHIVDCEGADSAVVQVLASSGSTVLTFEGRISESAPWVALSSNPTNSTNRATCITATAAITTPPAFGWILRLGGIIQMRTRVSTYTSGNVQVGVRLSDSPFA